MLKFQTKYNLSDPNILLKSWLLKFVNTIKLRFNAHEKHTELILCLKVEEFTCTQVTESKFEIRLKTDDEL